MKLSSKNFFSIKFIFFYFSILLSISYFRTINAPYQFDDGHTVEGNVTIRTLKNIPLFWTDAGTSSLIPENRNYRPLLFTGYAFCWWVADGAPWPFHVFKLLLALGICVAFFLVWRKIYQFPGMFPPELSEGNGMQIRFPFFRKTFRINGEFAAFLVATLFAIHPAATECLIYVASTSSLQAAFFYVWAFWFYLKSKDQSLEKSLEKNLGLSLLFYFLSSASKEEGITFPAMIIAAEFLWYTDAKSSLGRRLKTSFIKAAPYLLTGLILAVWIVLMLPKEGGESRGRLSGFSYFVTQWGAYLWYLKLWFWPFSLNADDVSMQPIKTWEDVRWIQFLIGNLAVIALAAKLRKKFPLILFGLFWFYISLAPTSSFIPLAEMTNERRMYLGFIGFGGAVFPIVLYFLHWLFSGVSQKRKLGWLFTLIAIGFFVGVQERNRVWLTSENLWKDTLEKNPQSGRARNNLALVYMAQGRHEEALVLLNQCEAIWTTYPVCSLNKAISLQALKRYDEAEASFKRTLSLQPTGTHANFHAGTFYYEVRKNYQKAAAHFAASSNATGGRYPSALIRYSLAMRELGDLNEARKAILQALALDSRDITGYFELGRLEISASNFKQARDIYLKIVQQYPNHWGSWYNLGVSEKGLNNLPAALSAFNKVAEALPNDLATWVQIAEIAKAFKDKSLHERALAQIKNLGPSQSFSKESSPDQFRGISQEK